MHAQDHFPPPAIHASTDLVSRDGEWFFEVRTNAVVRATPEQAWSVLTDYESLPGFVPDLLSSHVLARDDDVVTLEQSSRTGFLFFSHTVHMVLRITEHPPSAIDVALVSGNMRRYNAHWELESLSNDGADGTRIAFSGAIEPAFFIPPPIIMPIVETNVRKMVQSVVREIERRSLH
jgi:ribosome-associated toxin RatA of RatAB toxin-antitoxin module